MAKRILHVVTNVAHYDNPPEDNPTEDNPTHPTGLWLSELTHAYDVFTDAGYEQQIVSPAGGSVPLEPRSLKFPNFDKSAKAWKADGAKMALLAETASPDGIDGTDFDAIYFTGGHAVMYDFPDSEGLQRITREIFEHGGVVSSVCHGYCGLLNTRLSDGSLLVAGRELTGFAWIEEVLARVTKLVPYNAEAEMKQRGARYRKGLIPFASHVVTDGRLVTGQNPGSAKATATAVVSALGR
ncbi:type 1 glutamine amidotransferase domain-containing protein [Mycobacterium koreense]|uniref:Type 1 glutamine amidotransferase domain-containing protein n=1 Tax=Mycolicibacillus koreensis TaxID=1069220 RepID=A0A7I7S910_9MYCO|nr:type 1 glutamine amidotransferase domain-containing protein [Mycolicibacillus koreensis]MCV7249272.1 type 1 glutamine amidotransferase domain-containing protein [Mycolicibacillus koreensis]ODR10216.1 dimethyl sulfoxide reductase [Mycolicibacillus koreensis]OSC35577.1 type 1 glutamine amidotransferase domain-containing protein [Mycolicibacillus koreensis]BBY53183.1 type 1 glutamine amidotransferase domain-containing protein [Mycolicibacillus koreensis]